MNIRPGFIANVYPAPEHDPELLDLAFGLLCNVGNGEWSSQELVWQSAGRRWQQRYLDRDRSRSCGRRLTVNGVVLCINLGVLCYLLAR